MERIETEMSKQDPRIPRFHKDFDMDIILKKRSNDEILTKEEYDALNEVQEIYYATHYAKIRKEMEEWRKAHRGEYLKSVNRHTANKR